MRKFVKVISVAAAVSMAMSSMAVCAAEEETFLIGGIGPLTGAAASYGNSVKNGAEIAIAEINEAGGVVVGDTTYKFAMNYEDDEATEDKAIQAYNKLMDDGVNAILGTVTSGACIAVVEQSQLDGILQITPTGSAEACIEPENVFRICFSDPEQGIAMADFAIEELGYTKIAVLWNASDEYSIGLKEAFEAEVVEKGGEIVASESFTTEDVDFSTQLTTIKGTDAEAIYVPAYYQAATYITKQAAEAGIELPFLGSDGWDGVLKTVTDPATVEGCIFTSPFCAAVEDEVVVKFVEAYEEAYEETPDQFAADAYDAVYTFKAVIEAAESIESEDMIAAMTEISVSGLTGDPMTFDENGAAVKEVRFVTVTEETYQFYGAEGEVETETETETETSAK